MQKQELAQHLSDHQEKCRNGHVRSEENTIWEKGSNGKMRRRCRICRKNSQAARLRERTGIDAIPVQPVRHYTDLTGEALKATQEFAMALNMVDAKCRNKPELYSDYEDDAIPTPEYATELCRDCPLQALCLRDADVMRPGWGVRAAEVWVYGSRYYGGTDNGPEQEKVNDSDSSKW